MSFCSTLYTYFKQIYHIFSIFINIINIKSLVIDNKKIPKKLLIKFRDNVDNIGLFAIKIVQWSNYRIKLTINNKFLHDFLDKLNIYYENCESHSLDMTKKIYQQDFNKDISEHYIIEKQPIASGSIGQVYKVRDYNNNLFAIKCVHPDIYNSIFLPKLLFLFYNNYMTYLPYFNRYKLPIDINGFFSSLEKQMDLNYEGENIKKMNLIYKNNPYIIIPRLIRSSKNILIMSYEEGESFRDSEITKYKKYKIIKMLTLFVRSSAIINGFLHGDLHSGNWKICLSKKINNIYPIIIYDLGICIDLPKNFISQLIYAIDSGNIKLVIELMLSDTAIYKNNYNEDEMKYIKAESFKKLTKLSHNSNKIKLNFKDIIIIIRFIISKNIIFRQMFITIIVTILLTTDPELSLMKERSKNIVSKNYNESKNSRNECKNSRNESKNSRNESISKVNYINDQKNNLIDNEVKYNTINSTYPEMISFCDTYNIFQDYSKLMKQLQSKFNDT
jgi:predicted unusual protein kinase regulating ubiquinone biosynthesis (AarF/ABC1/UbiB family)